MEIMEIEMINNLFKYNKALLLYKLLAKTAFIIRLLYPKIRCGGQNILRFGRAGLIPVALMVALALPSLGCSDKKDAQTGEKSAEELRGVLPDVSVAEKRAKREAEFLEASQDPTKTPITDPNQTEKAASEYGFGERTEAQIEKEKPRANRIGVLAPLVGDVEFFGKETVDGSEMASDEINESGGIKKQQFDLVVYDTKASMDGAKDGAKLFINQNVVGVIGAPTGEVSFSATKIINEGQLILISAGSRRRLGDSGPYNFRNTLNDNYAIHRLVEYVVSERKWKKFAIFTSVVNDYSIQLSAAFKAEVAKQNAVLTDELYLYPNDSANNVQQDETSIPAQLKKLVKNKPDAVI